VDVAGIRTRYYDAGEGEPLILMHGGQYGSVGVAEDWDLNFDGFARSFRTIAVDMLGQGFTGNPKRDEEYVIGTTVKHILGFMDVLGIENAHLAGHSRGGYTALRLAMEHPGRARSVVDVDSASFIQEVNEFYAEAQRKADQYGDPKERLWHYERANSYGGNHITDEWLEVKLEARETPERKEVVSKIERLGAQFSRDIKERQPECHDWVRAGRLRTPTLITWGYDDPSATWDPIGLKSLDLILPNNPKSHMVVFNRAGHYCYREQPKAFVEAVSGFIQSFK
jgi:pimeloyl-ACP methyl ester carboxylesterase